MTVTRSVLTILWFDDMVVLVFNDAYSCTITLVTTAPYCSNVLFVSHSSIQVFVGNW